MSDYQPRIEGRLADRLEQVAVSGLWAWLVYRVWPPAFTFDHAASILLLLSEGTVLAFLLLRRPTDRISLEPSDWVVAAGGSLLQPLVSAEGSAYLPALGAPLMLIGLLGHLGAKLSLNVSFGLVAANRGVKARGLYRLVRHPMYAGYMLSHIGFLLVRPSWWNAALYTLVATLMLLRIRAEERVLCMDPTYLAYAERVRYRLLPGIY